ncbi:antifreeze protein Maxi-like [Oryza brachyantha]|uniref:antifreeze protein Maxi-like n=1 Tax=Oryza brachyantha TaxID=4533 RepID=UPI001AD9E951|nr:antifreeze protein Maxi-like [Oryza brachyantha]
MAPSFGRSISFPLSPARSKPRAAAPCHVRSISLPCRSHPLLSHLQSHIAAVRSWLIQDASSLSAGLAHIHALHAALADLLLLPDPQDTLRRATATADRLLDAFLLLADAHQGFQEALLDLRQDVAEARAALRRGDAARLASAVRSQRRAEKELSRLASTVSAAATAKYPSRLGLGATAEETEMAAALMDAAAASAAASAAVFSAAASMSSAAASSCKKTPAFAAFAKKASPETAEVALDRFEELERCIEESESSCHKVFRGILHTRVALLNIQTPTF